MLYEGIAMVRAAQTTVDSVAGITRLAEDHRKALLDLCHKGQAEIQDAIGQLNAAFGDVASATKTDALATLQNAHDRLGELIAAIVGIDLDLVSGQLADTVGGLGEFVARALS